MIKEVRKVRKLLGRMEKRLDAAQKDRDEVCQLLCGLVQDHSEMAGFSADDTTEIIAPKDGED